MEDMLPIIWGVLIATGVFVYVALDGFDLGIGILFPLGKTKAERDQMMNSVAPVWDGNETWLVLGGGGLFAVFPLAYSVLLTAFYAPVMVMLAGLIFRGVAFEFRFKDGRHRGAWDLAFMGGSLAAAFSQGIMLGAFIQGVAVDGRSYAGGWWDWLTPFTVFTGFATVAGYALLGATWLNWKTDGDLQARMKQIAPWLAGTVLAAIGIVSLITPSLHPEIAARWFGGFNAVLLAPLPIATVAVAALLVLSVRKGRELAPFLAAEAMFLLSFIGVGVTTYPYIIPRAVRLEDAAGPASSLGFLLVGTVVLLPMVLGYTAYSYWVFRGKVRLGEGYH